MLITFHEFTRRFYDSTILDYFMHSIHSFFKSSVVACSCHRYMLVGELAWSLVFLLALGLNVTLPNTQSRKLAADSVRFRHMAGHAIIAPGAAQQRPSSQVIIETPWCEVVKRSYRWTPECNHTGLGLQFGEDLATSPRAACLVTGCGRSGTLYLAHFLNSLGWEVNHDNVRSDAIDANSADLFSQTLVEPFYCGPLAYSAHCFFVATKVLAPILITPSSPSLTQRINLV